MNTENISGLINLLRQIKEQGGVDDSLVKEIELAIETLERESECKVPLENIGLVLGLISKVVAVLPEVRKAFEALTKFLE